MVLAVEQCRCFFTGGFILEHASDYETALHCAVPMRGAVSVHNNPVLQSENQHAGHCCSLSTEAVRANTQLSSEKGLCESFRLHLSVQHLRTNG